MYYYLLIYIINSTIQLDGCSQLAAARNVTVGKLHITNPITKINRILTWRYAHSTHRALAFRLTECYSDNCLTNYSPSHVCSTMLDGIKALTTVWFGGFFKSPC